MKKFFAAFVLIAIGIFIVPAFANETVNVRVDGALVSFPDQPAMIIDGRTVVPIRAVSEALGAAVGWDDATQSITLVYQHPLVSVVNPMTISLQIGSNTMTMSDAGGVRTVTLDVPPQIINGRTMVPFRAITEAFGCGVEWHAASRTAYITTPGSTPVAIPLTPTAVVSRGRWNENVWTSDYLGLTFTLPRGWISLTDEQWDEVSEIGMEAMNIDPAVLQSAAIIQDMIVTNTQTGASVQVVYERLPDAFVWINERQFLESTSTSMEASGFTTRIEPGTTRIGSYDWTVMIGTYGGFDVDVTQIYYVNILNGYVRILGITLGEGDESAEEILALIR
jgi:hypothetical protein